jgi:hypothetical protein
MATFYGFKCPTGHVHIGDTTVTGWKCPDCARPVAHDWRIPGGALDAYAWPGGYPIIYLDSNGETLCAKCAEADRDDPDTKPMQGRGIHWEGAPEHCAECGEEIPSAYGEPE